MMQSCSLWTTSILESFDTAVNTIGFHISWAKTKIQNVASGPPPLSCVISRHQVEAVNRFTYLGSDVNLSGYCTSLIHYVPAASCLEAELAGKHY